MTDITWLHLILAGPCNTGVRNKVDQVTSTHAAHKQWLGGASIILVVDACSAGRRTTSDKEGADRAYQAIRKAASHGALAHIWRCLWYDSHGYVELQTTVSHNVSGVNFAET